MIANLYPSPPGDWPVCLVQTEFMDVLIEFAWSTFDVWPELLEGVERARLRRAMKVAA